MYSNNLVDYFKSEIQELRENATLFGEDYSSIADELQMSNGKSNDPHIEQLLQSFAWMSARLRFRLDRSQEMIPQILLQSTCPNLVRSIPSMTVAQIKVKADGADFAQGQRLNKHRQCFTHVNRLKQSLNKNAPKNNNPPEVRFRTGYDTVLWPIQVTQADKVSLNDLGIDILNRYRPSSAIKIKIIANGNEPLNKMAIQSLKFYIDAEASLRWKLLNAIQNDLIGIIISGDEKSNITVLNKQSLTLDGFVPEQLLLKQSNRTLPAYELLIDYFFFPEKHCFFTIDNLTTLSTRKELNITLLFNEELDDRVSIEAKNFRLNCVPLVNLFTTSCEPIKPDIKRFEHTLRPDYRSDRISEVNAINRVTSVSDTGICTELQPFLAAKKLFPGEEKKQYWLHRNQPSQRKSQSGTESFISFFNSDLEDAAETKSVIHVDVTCTNRDLAESIRIGNRLKLIGEGPVEYLEVLRRPTAHKPPSSGGWQLWQLAAQTSLYHSSLLDSETGIEHLKTILNLYCNTLNSGQQRQIHSIKHLSTEQVMLPNTEDAWRGFRPGIKIKIEIDHKEFEDGSLPLFARVLHHFFALYSPVNCFTQLELNGESNLWPPLAGLQTLL